MTYHMTSVVTPPPYCSGFRAEIEAGAVDDDIISRHGCKKFVEVKLEKKKESPPPPSNHNWRGSAKCSGLGAVYLLSSSHALVPAEQCRIVLCAQQWS